MNSKPSVLQRMKIAYHVFRNGFPRRNYLTDTKQKSPLIWPEWRLGKPTYKMVDIHGYIEDGFNINSLIYSAIMYKARSSIIPTLRAYEGDPENPKLCKPNHALAKIIARPNPSQSWREFQMRQTIFLNLTGDAFAYLLEPNKGSLEGASFIGLDSNKTYIIPNPDKNKADIMGYWYVPEGRLIQDGLPLLPQYVSHVKLPNPGDPLEGNGYGLSPLAPASRTANVDNAITDFIKIFFEKGAVIPGILSTEQSLTDETVGMIKDRWNEVYGGYDNWTDIGVMDKGTKYQRIGMDFTEMSFNEQDERNEARILGPFGVPISLLDTRSGLKASTFNNKENDRRMFWEDIMLPEIGLFEDDYQYYLNTEDGAFVKYDYSDVPALRRDIPKMTEAAYRLWTMGETRNNAYAIVGLPGHDTPGGDTSYLPFSVMPVGNDDTTEGTTNTGAASAEDEARDEGKTKSRRKVKK